MDDNVGIEAGNVPEGKDGYRVAGGGGRAEKGLEGVGANSPSFSYPVVNPIELTFDLSVDYLTTG